MPERETLQQLFKYDRRTGRLLLRQVSKYDSRKPGDEAGWVQRSKYRIRRDVEIDGRCLRVHRVIWTIVYGDIPDGFEIDHIDHDALNNRIENLRLATHAENSRNKSLSAANTSGYNGIFFHTPRGRWIARIGAKEVGTFRRLEDAVSAYQNSPLRQPFHPNHGKKKAVRGRTARAQ